MIDNPDSPEAVEARKSQEDPIVMYLVVKESLGMGVGKTAAQCAHAAQMLLLRFVQTDREAENRSGVDEDRDLIFMSWLQSSFRKVVLRADDKEFEKLKEAFPYPVSAIVTDAGLTEIAAGSETVIGLWPMRKSAVPKLVKKLQVLK